MKITQVAAQLYTCRDLLKTPADIAKTLRHVRTIGYTAVQVSGMGPIAESELNAILDGEGLTCCATHEPGDVILKTPEKVVERLQKLRCTITAYPYPGGVDFTSADSVRDLCLGLDRSGKVLADAGLTLCYHNHNCELRKLDGKVILETIYDSTNPRYVQGETDTFWIHYGGSENVEWCERLHNRLPVIHLKDYRTNEQNQHELCEIGRGNLNFKKIIAAAEKSGCQWFIVEQDTCPGNPLDSLAQSFDYIRQNLVS